MNPPVSKRITHISTEPTEPQTPTGSYTETVDCLLEQDPIYHVAQLCNCLAVIPRGVSKRIAETWPWADVYGRRPRKSRNTTSAPATLGTCEILQDNTGTRRVVCMYAQWTPGRASDNLQVGKYRTRYQAPPTVRGDTSIARMRYFMQCCNWIDANKTITHLAVPYHIGCGLTGGDWTAYREMLQSMKYTHVRVCMEPNS